MKFDHKAMELFERAVRNAGYITSTTRKEVTNMKMTEEETKIVRAAVKASLELRQRYVTLMTEDSKMKAKQKRFATKEIPLLKQALIKLRQP